MAPGSCVDLEQSTLNKKAVYEIRQRYQTNLRPSPNPHLHRAPATDSPPATADTGCNFSSPSVPLNAYQATSRHYRSNDLTLWAMVRGRNVSGAAAKLPLLRHAKAAAAMERAHATCRQSRPSRRAQMNIPDQPMAMSHQIHTYTELRQQIHHDLRIQHPEWILPNGESPMCDSYEARLMELLDAFARKGSNESVAGVATV